MAFLELTTKYSKKTAQRARRKVNFSSEPFLNSLVSLNKNPGQDYKRDSVSISYRPLSFIWVFCHQKTLAIYPPALDEQPVAPAYLILQPIRFTHLLVTKTGRGLLPHIFTLTMPKRGGYFLWHLLFRHFCRTFPLGSMVLCVVPTFLPTPWRGTIERPAPDRLQNYRLN